MSYLINVLFYQPVFNLLIALYGLLGNNLGWAIVAVAAIVKLITIPITRRQIKSAEKMKEYQKEVEKIKEKYKNKDKQNEELAKVGTKYLPNQLGGCLPLIISLILLFQIRNVVIDLVHEGYHALNEVAYTDILKREEDSAVLGLTDSLDIGEHDLTVKVEASNGNTLEKVYTFRVVEDVNAAKEQVKEEEFNKSDKQKQEEASLTATNLANQIDSEIAVYIADFDARRSEKRESVVLSRTLGIFANETKEFYAYETTNPSFNVFMRPPSNETITNVEFFLGDEDVTANAEVQQGETLNLDFYWFDLSKVGADFITFDEGINIDWREFTPYLVLAVLLGASQYYMSQIQMGNTNLGQKSEEEEKNKKPKNPEDLDFAEIMQQSSKNMIYFLPIFSVLLSLGFLMRSNTTGAIFPAAVSLFWTVQNLFVIIQLVFTRWFGNEPKKAEKSKQVKETKEKKEDIVEAEIIEDNTITKLETSDSKKKDSKTSTKKKKKSKKKRKK